MQDGAHDARQERDRVSRKSGRRCHEIQGHRSHAGSRSRRQDLERERDLRLDQRGKISANANVTSKNNC